MDPTEPRVGHWRLSIRLGALAALSMLLVLPYLFELMPELAANSKVPLPALVVGQTLQSFVLFSALAWLGLRMGYALKLDAPLLRAWVHSTPIPERALRGLYNAGLIGALCGGLIVLLDFATQSMVPESIRAIQTPPWWKGLLASFYGAIAEEILARLFLMTLLVWVAVKALRREPRAQDYWLAVVVTAMLFGIGHLPAAAALAPLTPEFLLRTVGLNMLAGVPLGWLFWRYGLEYAMVAHFAADIVLHVLRALF